MWWAEVVTALVERQKTSNIDIHDIKTQNNDSCCIAKVTE